MRGYIDIKHIPCGHIFNIRADNFINGGCNCPKCKSDKRIKKYELVERIEKILGNRYTLLTKDFTTKDHVKVRCNCCFQVFSVLANNILYSQGGKGANCSICDLEDRSEDFLDKLNRMYRDEYTLVGKYKDMHTRTRFRHRGGCKKTFVTTPAYMIGKKIPSCLACRDKKELSEKSERLKELHGDNYELLSVEPKGMLKVRHKKCGNVFEIENKKLNRFKFLCPDCRDSEEFESRKRKVIEEINRKYNYQFSYVDGYKDTKSIITFKCNKCNEKFSTRCDRMLYKKNIKCPNCKS
jgi:hypothetical protein